MNSTMIQVVITPQSLLETGIQIETIDNLRLFKFTDVLQSRLETLLEKNQTEKPQQSCLNGAIFTQ